MRAIFPNNPAGNNIIFRISTSHFTYQISDLWFIIGYPALFYYWESRAGTTTNAWHMNCQGPNIASVNRA